jgi:hypothetical protein
MDAERWRRIEVLFHAAAALPPAARPEFVHAATTPDISLYADVTTLLQADPGASAVLDHILARAWLSYARSQKGLESG